MKLTREEKIELVKLFLKKFEDLVNSELHGIQNKRNIILNYAAIIAAECISRASNKKNVMELFFEQVEEIVKGEPT